MKNSELDRIIEKSFGAEPDFLLRDEFAQRITTELIRRSQWKADLAEYLYLTAFSLFLLTVVTVIYYFIDKNLLVQIIAYMSNNIMQVAFALFLLNFILFADRFLLPLLFNRLKMNY